MLALKFHVSYGAENPDKWEIFGHYFKTEDDDKN